MTETPGGAVRESAEDPFEGAFMGGFNEALRLVLDDYSGDAVHCHVTVHEGLLQPYGIVHGGVYASLAESAASLGAATWNMQREPGGQTVGVSNSTHFLRAIREGTLHVTATPQHRGRTLQLWQVDITDDAGRLVAKSDVRLANLATEKPI
jgi:1,4-dihydroxy-2-naphthoyl-CoA hydrolase